MGKSETGIYSCCQPPWPFGPHVAGSRHKTTTPSPIIHHFHYSSKARAHLAKISHFIPLIRNRLAVLCFGPQLGKNRSTMESKTRPCSLGKGGSIVRSRCPEIQPTSQGELHGPDPAPGRVAGGDWQSARGRTCPATVGVRRGLALMTVGVRLACLTNTAREAYSRVSPL